MTYLGHSLGGVLSPYEKEVGVFYLPTQLSNFNVL